MKFLNSSKKSKNHMPYTNLTLAWTTFYLLIILIIPLGHLFGKTFELDINVFWQVISDLRFRSAIYLTFGLSFIVTIINLLFGLIVGWTITNCTFPGKKIIEFVIDLPLALPTAVAGLSLVIIYSPDSWFCQALGLHDVKIAFTKIGMMIALIFTGLPLAIRTLEPLFYELDFTPCKAAINLGASNWYIFRKILLPTIMPYLLSSFNICFAKALNEFGAIVFISSNIPNETEVISLLLLSKIEQFDLDQAYAIALLTLLISFISLLTVKKVFSKICS